MIGRIACRLGYHRPLPGGLWNAGYCFTACARCGRDMVRSAFGEWHVPRDHRVVWRPPADGRVAARAELPPAKPVPLPRAGARSPFDFAEFDQPADRRASASPTSRMLRSRR